jgi:hypothetical protein
MTLEKVNELFPVQGYGFQRFSKTQKATNIKKGWWLIEECQLSKGAQFLKQRIEI